jgi:uncharacterized membrane protein
LFDGIARLPWSGLALVALGGALIARLFGEEPTQQVQADLRNFKAMIEAGEIPSTSGQPSGREKVKEEAKTA